MGVKIYDTINKQFITEIKKEIDIRELAKEFPKANSISVNYGTKMVTIDDDNFDDAEIKSKIDKVVAELNK